LNSALRAAAKRGECAKLVANLPYQIASPLIIELLIAGVGLLAFTVQKEVAERLRATEKDDAYGPLSIMAQMLGSADNRPTRMGLVTPRSPIKVGSQKDRP